MINQWLLEGGENTQKSLNTLPQAFRVTALNPYSTDTLEKEMATHSSVLAWRIPGTGEPGGLPSAGSQRVGHD